MAKNKTHGGHISRIAFGILALFIVMAAYTVVAGAQGMDVSLNPTEGAPGTQVTATGNNWPVGHTIHVIWGWISGKDIKQTTVDPHGNFETTFIVPQDATPGLYTIRFWDKQGQTFKDVDFAVTEPCILGVGDCNTLPPPPIPGVPPDNIYLAFIGIAAFAVVIVLILVKRYR